MSAKPAMNEQRYGKLLAKVRPAVIETEEEYERLLNEAKKLFDKGEENLSLEEQALLELLVNVIEPYEEEHYELGKSATPRTILLHLMEAHDLKPKDLWGIFGSKGTTSEVLSGRREISKAKAKALAEFFHVSAELFI